MDVDDSSESRMSLDSLDHVYLGPDEELDSDSGSSRGPDVLDAIPDPSFPAQADDLALFNDPDLYLGPEDDLIECDDAPAVPDSPMTATKSTPEPPSVHPVVSEAPLSSRTTTPGRQSTQPDLTNEDLLSYTIYPVTDPKIRISDPIQIRWTHPSSGPQIRSDSHFISCSYNSNYLSSPFGIPVHR
ncbi:hypothetical protein F4604DRAFT_1958161 [Suillus subluteus]|nr:hypothetical protein F4604DRAFT_1963345 [Suillus subluteus]KAG1858498.1 hypothetical protein F4604DRAFT_1958161 [Suillus subluteus]